MTNERHQHLSNTYCRQGTKRRRDPDCCDETPFKDIVMTRMMITALHFDSEVCSYSPYSFYLKFICLCAPLVIVLDVCTTFAEHFVEECFLVLFFFPYSENPTTELGVDDISISSHRSLHDFFFLSKPILIV